MTGNRLSKPAFVDLLGRLVVSEFEPPGFPRLVRYSCEGQRLDEAPFPLDPAKRPVTTEDFLLGADGVAYATTFSSMGGGGSDSARAPDGDLDVPLQEAMDAPAGELAGDLASDPPQAEDAERRGDPDAAAESPRFECTPRVTSVRPSLETQPRILWKTDLRPPRGPAWDGVAVTRDRVSVASGDMAYILDRKGNQTTVTITSEFYRLAGVVADPQGNFARGS